MKKLKIVLLCLLPVAVLHANMASPVQKGTLGTRPFLSQYVNILHENLRIVINEDFTYADFEIEYHIEAEKSGTQIPLLFYASEYYGNFQVTIDGQKIALKQQEQFWDAYGIEKEKLTDFHYLYAVNRSEIAEVQHTFHHGRSDRVYLRDFLYFETDISKGKHSIKVTYRANNWRYKHNRLNEDSFRYALAPAKYWKSFGTLAITIDATNVKDAVAINLGTPVHGNHNEISTYHFDMLPVEMIQITRMPTLNSFAKFLLKLESFWLAIILVSFIIIFHVWMMYRFRKKHPKKKISIPAIVGVCIVPLLFIFMLLIATFWIDASIGKPYASGRESYGAFYAFLYLPKYILYYLIFSILIDFLCKKMSLFTKSNTN